MQHAFHQKMSQLISDIRSRDQRTSFSNKRQSDGGWLGLGLGLGRSRPSRPSPWIRLCIPHSRYPMTLCGYLIISCPTLSCLRRFRQWFLFGVSLGLNSIEVSLKDLLCFYMLLSLQEIFHCSIDFVFSLFSTSLCSGRNMSIISIVDKSRSLSIKFDTNQSTNIGCR